MRSLPVDFIPELVLRRTYPDPDPERRLGKKKKKKLSLKTKVGNGVLISGITIQCHANFLPYPQTT